MSNVKNKRNKTDIDGLEGRAWMVTIWPKSIRNLGYGDLLDDDDRPKDKTGKQVLEQLREDWACSGKGRTSGGVSALSEAQGWHIHLGVYCGGKVRLTTVSRVLGNAHVDPQRSTKEELTAYLRKEGKHAEKGEIILYESSLESIQDGQGQRTDLNAIEEMIMEGKTPAEIMDSNFAWRKYEKMIKDAFYSKRAKETPPFRDVKVVWHVGEAGSGKSYNYVKLCESPDVGESRVYLLTDYDNGGFDNYCAEPILFMDEFKGQMKFQLLLNYLDGYKIQVHARYGNVRALWNEVHITSVYPPEEVYKHMVEESVRALDSVAQLKRRIDEIVFHWKRGEEYCEYSMPMKEYIDYGKLRERALASVEFEQLPLDEYVPFL